MPPRQKLTGRLGRRFDRSILTLALALFTAIGAFGQNTFGAQAVGASASQTVTVTATAAGTVATVRVLTMGTVNLDYTAGSGTCASASLAVNQQCTQTVNFTPAFPGQRLGAVVLLDSGNNVIGTSYLRGTGLGGLAVLIPGNEVLYAGSGAYDLVEDGQPAVMADLNLPASVALDGAGNLYIADSAHDRIRKVDAITHIISTVVGNGNSGVAPDGTPAVNASLNLPSGVAVDGAGNLYIADTKNNAVRVVSAATGLISTVAGNGTVGFTGDNGPATSATLDQPWGVTVDGAGNLYIADTNNHAIRKVNISTGIITTVAGTGYATAAGAGGYTGDGGLAINARLNFPYAVAFDAAGNMLIPDSANNCVRVVNTAGIISTLVGTGVIGYAGDGGPAAQAQLWAPSGVVVDPAGNIYISDSQNNAIRKVNALTGHISTSITTALGESVLNQQFIGNSLSRPIGLALDGYGNLYVADYYYLRVRQIQPNVLGLTVGTHSLTASYSGDTLHFASTSTVVVQVVNEATATTVTSSANPAALGSAVTFTVKVTAPNGGGVTPDGTITFMDGTTALTTVPLSAAGSATYTTSTLSDGAHAISAVFSGDPATYIVGSTSGTLSQDVLAASTVVVASNTNPSIYGSPVKFTATITSTATVAPTGTVDFLDGSAKIGSSTLTGTTGVATFTTSSLGAGNHAITAAYRGNTNSGPGTSPPIVQTVNLTQTTTTIAALPTTGIAGATVTLTAHVAVVAGSSTVTGTVTFTDGTVKLGTATVGVGGVATINPVLAPGAHAIVAAYGGDTNDNGSTSTALAVNVVLATTSTALKTSASPAFVLSGITFTATVTGNGGVPTGSVTFAVDGVTASTTAVGASGTATFTDSALAVGTHTIVASYSGDTNDNPSASSALSQVVQAIPTVTNLGISSSTGPNSQAILVATAIGSTGPTPTGTVTFTYGSAATVIGLASLDSSGVATVVPDLPTGSYAVVASYSGDALHSPSTSSAVSFSSAPMGFDITVNPATLTLVSSQNATVNVNVTSNSGFIDTVGMGCLSLPAAVNCHFSSKNVSVGAGQTQSVQLTIDTNAPLSGGQSASTGSTSRGLSLAAFGWPASLIFGVVFWRFRKRNAAALVAMLALFLAGSLAVTGCGASFSQVTAAPGTYTIQVGGVGTGSNISHYQNVTLTITK